MKKFHFRLESLLILRGNQRDLCYQMLAEVLRQDRELETRRQTQQSDQTRQRDELRTLEAGGRLDVAVALERRGYLAQLGRQLDELDRQRNLLSQQISLCRKSLVKADQSVRSLENLKDRQKQEYLGNQQRSADLELEETWRASGATTTTGRRTSSGE